MTPEQKAAYVQGMSVSALADIEAMKIANAERDSRGEAPAYNEEAFAAIPQKYGLYHNALVLWFLD